MEAATSTFGLLERIKAGDHQAFAVLFDKYRVRLAVLIHHRLSPALRGTLEIDDIQQETFLKAFRELDHYTYQSPGSFLRWLARLADHVIIDLARYQDRQKRRATAVVPFRSASNPAGPEPVDSQTPSRLWAERERVEALLAKLEALPAEYRQVILLSKIEGLSTQEVAEQLGKSREATALLLHRALKRLRQLQA